MDEKDSCSGEGLFAVFDGISSGLEQVNDPSAGTEQVSILIQSPEVNQEPGELVEPVKSD